MDGTRFDAIEKARPPDRVARGGFTRRTVLRLAAGGALALAVRPVREARALTAHPALDPGWTHLAGTTSGLVCYRAGDGVAFSGTCVDGLFTAKRTHAFSAGWTQIVGANRSLLFYRRGDGLGAIGFIGADGVFVQPPAASLRFAAGLLPCPGTRSGRLALYRGDQMGGLALTNDGRMAAGGVFDTVGAGWTHLVGVGFETYLFYRADTGAALGGRIEARPVGAPSRLVWVPQATHRFSTGWTHVVGTFNGGLLFYNRLGRGATGFLDALGNFTQTGNPTFELGWTHVAGAGGRGVLFYDKRSGRGSGGFLSARGVWTETTTYGEPPRPFGQARR